MVSAYLRDTHQRMNSTVFNNVQFILLFVSYFQRLMGVQFQLERTSYCVTLIPAALEAAFLNSASHLNLQSESPAHCLQDMVWSFLEASKIQKQLIILRGMENRVLQKFRVFGLEMNKTIITYNKTFCKNYSIQLTILHNCMNASAF